MYQVCVINKYLKLVSTTRLREQLRLGGGTDLVNVSKIKENYVPLKWGYSILGKICLLGTGTNG